MRHCKATDCLNKRARGGVESDRLLWYFSQKRGVLGCSRLTIQCRAFLCPRTLTSRNAAHRQQHFMECSICSSRNAQFHGMHDAVREMHAVHFVACWQTWWSMRGVMTVAGASNSGIVSCSTPAWWLMHSLCQTSTLHSECRTICRCWASRGVWQTLCWYTRHRIAKGTRYANAKHRIRDKLCQYSKRHAKHAYTEHRKAHTLCWHRPSHTAIAKRKPHATAKPGIGSRVARAM